MAVTLTLRTDADGRVVSSLDGETLAITPLAALPTLERLQADPFHVGATLTAALGGATLLSRLDAEGQGQALPLLLLDCDARADAIPWEFAALPAQAFVAQYGLLRLLDLSPQPPSRIGKGEQNSPLLSGEGAGEVAIRRAGGGPARGREGRAARGLSFARGG